MFTRQAPPILNALWQGGLSAAAASSVQNLLGQCRAPLRHNGPIQFDYTRPSMKEIGPQGGGQEFPGSVLPKPRNFPGPSGEEEEEEEEQEPEGFLPPEHFPSERQKYGPGEAPFVPGQPGPPPDLFPGKYTYLDRQKNEVGLECNDFRRHAVFPRALNIANTINSVTFFGRGVPKNFVELDIIERARSTDFTVRLPRYKDWLVRLGRTSAPWAKGTTQNIDLIFEESCTSEGTPAVQVEAHNTCFDVASNRVVILGQAPNECWYLLQAESCGYSEGCSDCPEIGGQDLTTVENYNAANVQFLGHELGCLKWVDTTDCEQE